jgi:hypothetical protein
MFMEGTQELKAIRSELANALERLDRLIKRVEQPMMEATSDHVKAMDRTKAIEWTLQSKEAPMRPVEIWAELQRHGRNDPKMEVQVTTYDLWQRGRIGKLQRGLYVSTPDGARG